MAKKNKGKNKYKENKKKEPNKLALGKYTDNFECLKNGEKIQSLIKIQLCQ